MRVILVLDFPAGLEAQGRDAARDLFRRWVAPSHLIGAEGGAWLTAVATGSDTEPAACGGAGIAAGVTDEGARM